MASISGSVLYLRRIGLVKVGQNVEVDIRLCLLTVEWVDFASGQHIRKHKIFQDLNTLWTSCLIVIPETLEEIFACTIPLALPHPHLATAFFDNPHDPRVWYGRPHIIGCVVNFLSMVNPIELALHKTFNAL